MHARKTTSSPRSPRALQIIDTSATRERQDCSVCLNLPYCWDDRLSDRAVILNLLACRVQRNVDRDRSIRLFLDMIRPKLIKMAASTRGRGIPDGAVSIEELVADMESVVAEHLIGPYLIGEVAHPLHYLFGRPGVVRRWLWEKTKETQRFYAKHILVEPHVWKTHEEIISESGQASSPWSDRESYVRAPDADEGGPIDALIEEALAVVDDGVTLSLNEYRVFKFCLTNAKQSAKSRPTDTLHLKLSGYMKADRRFITRLFGRAERRIVDAVGRTDEGLRRRGIDPAAIPSIRKKRIRRVRGVQTRLSAAEIKAVIEFIDLYPKATYVDLAWACGISKTTLIEVMRRYRGKSLEDIQAALASNKQKG